MVTLGYSGLRYASIFAGCFHALHRYTRVKHFFARVGGTCPCADSRLQLCPTGPSRRGLRPWAVVACILHGTAARAGCARTCCIIGAGERLG